MIDSEIFDMVRWQMSTTIPTDFAAFVERMVAERRFSSEQEVIAEGLRLLQARETLREDLEKGAAQLDAGLGIPAEKAFQRARDQVRRNERGEA
jgi:putative addiction module CopG family antidote